MALLDFGWQTYALLGAGLLVVVLEVFFPSGGLLGIGATVCLLLGGWFSFRHGGIGAALAYGVLVALLAPVTLVAAFGILPRTPMGKAIILRAQLVGRATEPGLEALVGARGVAATPLRPAGIALVEDRRIDVVTRGTHLAAGEALRVVKVEGNRVVVEPDVRVDSALGPAGPAQTPS